MDLRHPDGTGQTEADLDTDTADLQVTGISSPKRSSTTACVEAAHFAGPDGSGTRYAHQEGKGSEPSHFHPVSGNCSSRAENEGAWGTADDQSGAETSSRTRGGDSCRKS